MPDSYLRAGGWVAIAVAAYLALVHLAGGSCAGGRKEALVGLLFAGGVAVPLLASLPERASDWLPGVGAFAALCWLNCRLIDRWEGSTRPAFDVGVAAATAVSLALTGPTPVAFAVTASVVGLAGVHSARRRLGVRAARVLADVALLTPLAGAIG